jgi:sec-independent protein translocase protein TatC
MKACRVRACTHAQTVTLAPACVQARTLRERGLKVAEGRWCCYTEPMPEPREDDLFRESTMTFGEHLGELRNCLLKSIYGLAIGFIIGLSVGKHVVYFIQQPLNRALTTYYQQESAERVRRELEKLDQGQWDKLVEAKLAELKKSGQVSSTPDEARKRVEEEVKERVAAEVHRRVEEEHLLADEVYVDPAQALQELKNLYPEQLKNVSRLPQSESSDTEGKARLLRLFLWHRIADDPRLQSKGLSVFEGFGVWVKTSLLLGILLASPWIFYQIWNFVAAGLYPHERRYVHLYLPFSIGLFLFGAALAFFVVFGPVLAFLLSFNRSMDIGLEPRINEWLSFVWVLPVGFGIGFQLPLVMLFMERIGVFTVKSYLAQWRIAVLVIVVIAGILMPPDPYSMLLNAGALTVLYFGGILLCKLMPRRSSPFGAAK